MSKPTYEELERRIRALEQNEIRRKKAEKSLKVSEERFRAIFEQATVGLAQIASKTGDFVLINQRYADIVGYTIEEMKHLTFQEIIHPDDLQDDLNNMQHLLDGEISEFSMEKRYCHKDGSLVWVNLTVFPMLGIGETQNYHVAVVVDITDVIKAEEEKRKALEFAAEQSRHALIGQVAGKMAHDFNNVLMVIMGNAQLAMMDCDDEDIEVLLEHINEFSQRGRDITNKLLSYSKDQEPKQTYFKIEDKIELVLKMLEKDLSGIKISRNYKPVISELLADPGMIQDALVYLIQNSIHAMSKVKNPRLNLKAYSQDDKIYFEIEDNGCGIPKEHQDSIYTPSFTLKGSHDETRSYKPGIKGTGYGMSNVKKYIVEKHRGDIFLESEVGKGTKVSIAFRIIKDHLSSDEKKEVVKNKIYDKRRVLLVEDETAIANVQYQILTKEPFGHIVSIAANGQIAIDTFDRNKFDVVSLDYMLPGNINGLDVYHHIRKKDEDIPIMFISGNIEFLESMKKLKGKDPNLEYLSKPIANLEYVNKINELIGSNI
ncbi:MAG: PAS domain S-box protein [Deltaproteobacteria bacterium]|nr:PAS domain S-box protein [Deltaproteobacteria bacterium]